MLLAESDMSRVQTPEPLAVVVPTLPIRLLVSVIVTLGSDVPDIVIADVRLVTLSVLDEPVSSAVARSRAAGTAGAVVSIVTDNEAELAEVLPAVSVAVAVST